MELTTPTTLELDVQPPDVSAGLYLMDFCNTDLVDAYQVYVQAVPSGAPAPQSRRIADGWDDAFLPIAFGSLSTLTLDCSPGFDYYFATSLILGSGFPTSIVSANSFAVRCAAECTVVDADLDGSPCGVDCDDGNATVYPGAPPLCDGINNDCDDPTWPVPPPDQDDTDGDGFRICEGDCDDANPGGGGRARRGSGDFGGLDLLRLEPSAALDGRGRRTGARRGCGRAAFRASPLSGA